MIVHQYFWLITMLIYLFFIKVICKIEDTSGIQFSFKCKEKIMFYFDNRKISLIDPSQATCE